MKRGLPAWEDLFSWHFAWQIRQCNQTLRQFVYLMCLKGNMLNHLSVDGLFPFLLLERYIMQGSTLQGMRVAILVTDDFEQAELAEPKKALEQAGATAKIISPKPGKVQGM